MKISYPASTCSQCIAMCCDLLNICKNLVRFERGEKRKKFLTFSTTQIPGTILAQFLHTYALWYREMKQEVATMSTLQTNKTVARALNR